jgi:hypothetical protein
MTHVETAKGGEVKERTESHSVCVRVINRDACVLSSRFEFLLENRPI